MKIVFYKSVGHVGTEYFTFCLNIRYNHTGFDLFTKLSIISTILNIEKILEPLKLIKLLSYRYYIISKAPHRIVFMNAIIYTVVYSYCVKLFKITTHYTPLSCSETHTNPYLYYITVRLFTFNLHTR